MPGRTLWQRRVCVPFSSHTCLCLSADLLQLQDRQVSESAIMNGSRHPCTHSMCKVKSLSNGATADVINARQASDPSVRFSSDTKASAETIVELKSSPRSGRCLLLFATFTSFFKCDLQRIGLAVTQTCRSRSPLPSFHCGHLRYADLHHMDQHMSSLLSTQASARRSGPRHHVCQLIECIVDVQ